MTEQPRLPLYSDVVFHRLFQDMELLCSLLNAILKPPSGHELIQLLPMPLRTRGVLAEDKDGVMDLRARAADGRHMHIELQLRAYPSYRERIVFYLCSMVPPQLKRGQAYAQLCPVISIHLLYFNLLEEEAAKDAVHHVFELRERHKNLCLTNKLEVHTIEMRKFMAKADDLKTDEDRWLYYLLNAHQLSDAQIDALGLSELRDADQKLRMISQNDDLRVAYELRFKAEMDRAAERPDFIEYGKRLGIDEGKRLGMDEGERSSKRTFVRELCQLFSVPLGPERQARIERMTSAELDKLRQHLLAHRAWDE